jgi:integrase
MDALPLPAPADLLAELARLRAQLAEQPPEPAGRQRALTARDIRRKARKGGSMRGIKLSQGAIDALVAPAKGETFAWFSELPGFGIRVSASGHRAWVVQFRLDGRSVRKTLGDVRVLDIPRAKARARAILAAAEEGRDLVAEEAAEKAAQAEREADAAERSIGALVERFLAEPAVRRKRSYPEAERYLARVWQPVHDLPAETCSRHDLAPVLRRIATERGEVAANRARSALSGLFVWAITAGLLRREDSPVQFLQKWPEKPRDRALSLAELGVVWNAASQVSATLGAIVRLLILTGARKAEIAELRWSEVDLEAGEIRLPGSRCKNGRPLTIPLAPPAVALLQDWPRTSSPLLFGTLSWTWNKARLDALAPLEQPWVIHDLRRSVVTGLHEHVGVDAALVELIVNHVSGSRGGVAGVYNRAERLDERRRALQRWATLVLRAAGETPEPAKVVPLRA